MPRPRVKDEDRKRVARACDTCKRRKEKCDGSHPCLLCRRRGREPECTFTEGFSARRKRDSTATTSTSNEASRADPYLAHHRSASYDGIGNYPTDFSTHTPHRKVTLKDAYRQDRTSNADAEIAIESLLTLSGSRSTPKTPDPMAHQNQANNNMTSTHPSSALENPDTFSPQSLNTPNVHPSTHYTPQTHQNSVASRAPVPKLARLLKDGHGKFIFVGDSSNLAFVQNIRRLVKLEIGDSRLTSDPLRHAMVEAVPEHRFSLSSKVTKPTLSEARELVRCYLTTTSGVIDLFDPSEIESHISAWASHPSSSDTNEGEEFNASIYYLVCAIGAQVRNPKAGKSNPNSNGASSKDSSNDAQAELYLTRARQLVASAFMEDPSVLTIQSYALITFYMLSACRRNGAFMLLGIAVRAAYALGLHRNDISSLFEPRERKTRERVWKSLRVLDLYMSASLGRPPATSEVDGGSVSWSGGGREYEGIKMEGLSGSAMLRICFIFERIINEVYCRREVSVALVESISRQYRDWSRELGRGLEVDGLDGAKGDPLQQTIGVAHLKGAYYWSIILLTRPFLIFRVSSKIKGRSEEEEGGGNSVTRTLSEACIDAALRGVEIATDLIHTPGVPKRLFMVTNSTFISAMVIGFAIFGDFDKLFPLLSSVDQAIAILTIMAKDDPSARRYEQISTYLREAATEHIRRREQKELQKRRQDINNIFGDPVKEAEELPKPPLNNGSIMIPQDLADPDQMPIEDDMQSQPWQLRFDMPPESRGPVLTTSGTLADDNAQPQFDLSRYGFDQNSGYDQFSPDGSGIPSLPSYAEEFPLFSLMTEYDQLQDPYQLGVA